MGASLASRCILAAALLFVSLVCWEGAVAWGRYEPVSGELGGFVPTPLGVQVREPGFEPGDPEWNGPGALVPRGAFAGARYDVLTPFLLAPLMGSEPRLRLTHVLGPPEEGSRAPSAWAWGGGRDPLGRFFHITSPFFWVLVGSEERTLFLADFDLTPEEPVRLVHQDGDLALGAGRPE